MSIPPNKTRTKIIQATVDLLQAGGGSKVRMADIARAAGLSRQAVYLHFPSRADLLIAATRYVEEIKHTDARLAESRAAKTGKARLKAYIAAWGDFIPEIYGISKALMEMSPTDPEAEQAWKNRMTAMREGCAAAVDALARDGHLKSNLTRKQATDLLWTLLSVRNWELLRHDCGWSQEDYMRHITKTARRAIVSG